MSDPSGTDNRYAPTAITWIDIESDGSERVRAGHIWSEAPKVKAMRAFWVIAAEPEPSDPSVLPVLIANRVHRCGRALGGGFDRRGGRVIFKGEHYSERDHRSLARSLLIGDRVYRSRAPRAIVEPAVPPNAMQWFMRYGGGPSHDRFQGYYPDAFGADPSPLVPLWYEYQAILLDK